MSALDALSLAPLEHPSIACPVACGVDEEGRVYVVHTYLPGTPLSDFSAASARRSVDDIVKRLTDLAGALDYAAAANVMHGALSDSDVIFSSDSAGVSGLGLVQALESAGVPGFEARRENDVAALMEIAEQLLGDQASSAVRTLLSGPVPASALAFTAALHSTLDGHVDLPPPVRRTLPGRPTPDAGRTFSGLPSDNADLPFSDVDGFASEADVSRQASEELRDIQFRDGEERLETPLMFGALEPAPAARTSHRAWWLVIGALVLALGAIAGYAGGFFDGRTTSPAASVAPAETPKPEPTNGQRFTDASVDEAAKAPDAAKPRVAEPQPAPAPPRAESRPRPQAPAAASPAPPARRPTVPPARSGPAAMMVDSRPAGAQVFVDGQSVGYTPLVVGDLAPGTHSIRLQLPGFHPWVTAVTLSPGARERVAASLEQ